MQRRKAFTLLELLVVIGIILLLISILLPVLAGVRAQGHAVLCQNNERALWQGIMAFATDNEGHVVGNQEDTGNLIPSHKDWLRGSDSNNITGALGAPQAGTLWKYIHNPGAYLCPARDHDPSTGGMNTLDLTSNGHFDYAIFLSFAGAKLEHLPVQATVTDPSTGNTTTLPTPYLVEEQPDSITGSHREGGHATTDHIAHNHFGGSYYMAPDGSCQFYIERGTATAVNYTARTARSNAVSMGQNWGWGTWDAN